MVVIYSVFVKYQFGISEFIFLEKVQTSFCFFTLSELKKLEDGWQVSHFVSGAKLAYEEILMAFENGDLNKIKKLSSKDVYTAFKEVIDDRNQKGLQVEAIFGGVRDIRIKDVKLNKKNLEANITMVFQCDITYS